MYKCPVCFTEHNSWEGKGDIPELKGERLCKECIELFGRVKKHLQYLKKVVNLKQHPIFGGVYNAH